MKKYSIIKSCIPSQKQIETRDALIELLSSKIDLSDWPKTNFMDLYRIAIQEIKNADKEANV